MKRNPTLFVCALLLLNTAYNSGRSASALAAVSNTGAPTITTQPANATVKVGTQATFKVVASGTATLKYQWSKNGGTITGATSSTYKTPATTDADNNSYFTVVVSNSAGSSPSSNPAYLTVVDPPVIDEQPSSVTVTTPGVAEFDAYAYASQGPVTCQWYKNGHAIASATNYSYITEEITTADNGAAFTVIFTVTVNKVAVSTTSKAAILSVKGSTNTGTYPIVGNWSGTATITGSDSSVTTSQVVAAFSQTSYSLTGTIVFTDDSGIPTYGVGVASLNGQNLYVVAGGDGTGGIAGGFTANLLTLNLTGGGGEGNEAEFGSGSLTLSSNHQKLTGTGTDSNGDTMTWTLTRDT